MPLGMRTLIPIRMKRYVKALAVLAFALAAATSHAQIFEITGKITDADSLPIRNAKVLALGTSTSVKSDKNGAFCITLAKLPDTLEVKARGFLTRMIPVDKDKNRRHILLFEKHHLHGDTLVMSGGAAAAGDARS